MVERLKVQSKSVVDGENAFVAASSMKQSLSSPSSKAFTSSSNNDQLFSIVEYVKNEQHVPIQRQMIERWMKLSDAIIIYHLEKQVNHDIDNNNNNNGSSSITIVRDELQIKAKEAKSAQIARLLIQYDLRVNHNTIVDYLKFPFESYRLLKETESRERQNIDNHHSMGDNGASAAFYKQLIQIEHQSGASKIEIVHESSHVIQQQNHHIHELQQQQQESHHHDHPSGDDDEYCVVSYHHDEQQENSDEVKEEEEQGLEDEETASFVPYFRIEASCKYSIHMARALLNNLIHKMEEVMFPTVTSQEPVVANSTTGEQSSHVITEEPSSQLQSQSQQQRRVPDISSFNVQSARAMGLPTSSKDSSDSCLVM